MVESNQPFARPPAELGCTLRFLQTFIQKFFGASLAVHRKVVRWPEESTMEAIMSGVLVFRSLAEAIRAGFHVYDRTRDGYLMRTRTARGWAFALARIG
jgi:hypothetical protein